MADGIQPNRVWHEQVIKPSDVSALHKYAVKIGKLELDPLGVIHAELEIGRRQDRHFLLNHEGAKDFARC